MSLESARTSRLRHVRQGRAQPRVPVAPFVGGAAPIDRQHLERYTLGSPELEREILGLFVAQLPLSIEQLRFAVTDREWQVAAHTIKGSARAVGAGEVARLALDAEQLPAVEDEAERARILSQLEEATEAVQAYVVRAFPPELPHA